MAHLTAKQERGYRFECLVYEALKEMTGMYNLLHNVEYHKERYTFRQADLSYQIATPQGLELVLVEAKSSQGGPIPRNLRREVKKHGQIISPIITLDEEILERQAFVGAHRSLAVTNTYFDKEFMQAAQEQGIYVLDREGLANIFKNQGKSYSGVEQAVNNIYLNGQVSQKNIIYIR